MLEPQVLVPVLLTVAGGLAFLAYRHRPFYKLVMRGIILLTTATMILVAVWNSAVVRVWRSLNDVIPGERFDDGIEIMEAMSVPFEYVLLTAAAIWAFLFFLSVMPTHGDDTPPSKYS